MNETSKKSKADKCPSNKHDKSVIDVQKKCIINERVSDKIELTNGLVNGITNDLSVKKHSRKSKKNKNSSGGVNGESVASDQEPSKSKYPEINISDQNLNKDLLQHTKSIEESSSKNAVNNVHKVTVKGSRKKKNKVGQIVANISNNQVCDNELSSKTRISNIGLKNDLTDKELNKIVPDSKIASCSNTFIHEKGTELISSDSKNEKIDIVEVTDSLNKIELDSENPIDRQISTPKIDFIQYENELQMPMIMKIIQKDLSEPYSIYTYRYFIHNWPKLCFLVSTFSHSCQIFA